MITTKINFPSATIILDRPARCNALDGEMLNGLVQALDDVRQEKKVKGIIIAAAGSVFCSGADLRQIGEELEQPNAMKSWFERSRAMQSLLETMLLLPKPLFAAVDGACLDSGFALALACDSVLATPATEFRLDAMKRGLVSGVATPLLAFRGGAALASQMLLGRVLKAEQAFGFGLVHEIVDAELIWAKAHELIVQLDSTSAAESLQLSKKLLNEMLAERLSTEITNGAAAFASSLTTEAAREGIEAFVAKRPPSFP